MTAILEYLCAEVLEVAGFECLKLKRKIIKPTHIEFGVKKDKELARVFQNKTFPGSQKDFSPNV